MADGDISGVQVHIKEGTKLNYNCIGIFLRISTYALNLKEVSARVLFHAVSCLFLLINLIGKMVYFGFQSNIFFGEIFDFS